MRKVVSVLLSAAMALSLCAGCSSSSSDTADTKAAEEKGADAADTEAGEAAEGVMPAVAKEDLKVGVIHIGNPADGSGYSYTHDQGIVAMQKAVGLEDDQIIRKNNVADDDQTAIETAMQRVCRGRMPDYLRDKLGLHGCMRGTGRRISGRYLLPCNWLQIQRCEL